MGHLATGDSLPAAPHLSAPRRTHCHAHFAKRCWLRSSAASAQHSHLKDFNLPHRNAEPFTPDLPSDLTPIQTSANTRIYFPRGHYKRKGRKHMARVKVYFPCVRISMKWIAMNSGSHQPLPRLGNRNTSLFAVLPNL